MNKIISEKEILDLLTYTKSFMNHVYHIQQDFNLIPKKDHYGTCINYIDKQEYRSEFLDELVNTICEWVYSNKKAKQILNDLILDEERSEQNAQSTLRSLAFNKFRHRDNRDLFLQGQFGELLLFNFLQYFYKAVPLLRKMPITTSDGHERFGADAIHYRTEDNNNIFILGESKAYTNDYQFNKAFKESLSSILNTYNNHRGEMNFYLYDDFIDESLVKIAKDYKNGIITDAKVYLVCLITYNEKIKINKQKEEDVIKKSIMNIIKEHCSKLDENIFKDIKDHGLLDRINYIIFPIWQFKVLIQNFQKLIGK